MKLILDLDGRDPYWQMAIDEASLILRAYDVVDDFVRLWVFKPTTLSIGKFQSYEATVNEEKVKELGLPVVRRFTGGGAVVHDYQGEITWTVVMKGKSMDEAYRWAGDALVKALKEFGLRGEFAPINDVVVNGKKIVGMAGAMRRNAVLVHGTFMYATKLEYLSALKLPKEKEQVRGKPEERVTTLSLALGRGVSKEEAVRALVKGFCEGCQEASLSEAVLDLANELRWKYSNWGWTKWR